MQKCTVSAFNSEDQSSKQEYDIAKKKLSFQKKRFITSKYKHIHVFVYKQTAIVARIFREIEKFIIF